MKKTMTYVVAAAAVAMALVSCSKDKLIEKGTRNEQTSGMRTLTVSFAQGTKTSISNDMKTPVWAEGDQISLNGTPYAVPAEAVGTSTCKITTDIQGEIVAVYPASAWTAAEPHYKVEYIQDGSFSNANICIDTVKAGDTKIEFKNKTALFYVKIKAGDKKSILTVTSLKAIGTDGQRSGIAADINNHGVNANEITVSIEANPLNDQDCYVSVLPGVKLTDLNFNISRDGETGEQGGFSANYLKEEKNISDPYSCAVVENTIYTVEPSFLHEYVVVYLTKWATRNIGAATSADAGDYFAWGATELAYETLSAGEFAFKATKPASYTGTLTWADGSGFANCNTPYYDGNNYSNSKYNIGEGKKVLDLSDDAANANWGGAWCMPTKQDFDNLLTMTGTNSSNFSDGILKIKGHSSLIFPVAGYGEGTDLCQASSFGWYWSSSLCTDDPTCAYYLKFDGDGFLCTDDFLRYFGMPVRPFSY